MPPPAEPTADAPETEPAPAVGIFWGVPDAAGALALVVDRTPLAEAEPYGECLTHPRGHHEVWQAWRRLGATTLARRGLPVAIAAHAYEHFPRGRIVYRVPAATFTLYADRRLQAPAVIAELVRLFGLDGRRVAVRSDAHYRTRP